ncbi:hypothetical protein EHQ96_00665 [Leptospira levettii]|uniref:Uncharacterized protein n=1 Tax=Leptospira levettii TaxID=2023178 RepID=A0A5F2AFV7_9LEPT|nr:hypothetical protein [Leptospira levettii]MCG6148384.1 hypothetical protein [Leptospira levettii]MCW7464335.1 hypothetical protein [Leptospira levettii]MCW7508424.1 hypothetical protein [Leptospira levettii]MCW7511480.1 hypothetical protein [Leptospira levettii]MCW7515235.1 hypothetical protein [Leptospira levettii]
MDSSFKPKPLLNKSELRQIKRSKTRVEGKKVITDDVKKLKSLKVTPELSFQESIDYYKEPIWIEYYIPKESRFAFETKYLFILLVDPKTTDEECDLARKEAQAKNEIVDVFGYMESHPDSIRLIEDSYHSTMSMHETIHHIYRNYKETGATEDLKTACYLTEALLKYEPTIAGLTYFRDYSIYNLNFWIRTLNRLKIDFALEDATVSLLIKRRNELWEMENREEDEDFDLLAALFFEQAFPNRGAGELSSDDMLLFE